MIAEGAAMTSAGRYRQIALDLGVRALEREPLARHTWLKVGGPVDWLLFPDRPQQAAQLSAALAAEPLPVKILGAGSNIVVADEGLRAVVIATSALTSEPLYLGDGCVEALAGVPIPSLARWAARRQLAGLEFAEGIPAQLGGALRMNAGAHGSSFGAIAVEALLAAPGGAVERRRASPGDFEYRESFVRRDRCFAVGAVLRLRPDDPQAIRERMLAYRRRRRATQPVHDRSAGCVFANYPDAPVGRLVEELGLKGLRIGGAEVSTLHGNFIVNRNSARAADVLALIDLLTERLTQATGQPPRLEVEIWRNEP